MTNSKESPSIYKWGNFEIMKMCYLMITNLSASICKHFQKLIGLLLLTCITSLATPSAFAQKVLMLSTSEGAGAGLPYLANMQAEFENAGASVTRLDILSAANSVDASTFTDSPGPYDIVLLGSVYGQIHGTNWTAIDAAIASRAANSFMMFIDGCCQAPTNLEKMRESLISASGFALTPGAIQSGFADFPLNTNSLYQGFFSATLSQIKGGDAKYINGVPTENALYLPVGTVAMPPVGGTTSAYGMFLPVSQSYAGAGACTFAMNDISPFDPSTAYPANQGKIAAAFLGAAGPGGACGLAASITKTFSPATIISGQNATLSIQVANHTNPLVNVAALNVVDQLPTPLLVNGEAVSTCTDGTLTALIGSATVSLTGATLPAAGCTITVPVVWPKSADSQCINTSTTVMNTITPGSLANGGQFSTGGGQVNTPAQAELTCTETANPPVAPTPVPTLGAFGLLSLSSIVGLAGFVGFSRRRKQ